MVPGGLVAPGYETGGVISWWQYSVVWHCCYNATAHCALLYDDFCRYLQYGMV